MQPPPTLPDESERLAALRRYDILDTPAEATFDDFTRLASRICGTPIATITLVDAARQWFKSKMGLEERETPRDISFCGHAIAGSEILEVPDALEDERFRDNPLVIGNPTVRFYAGAPLVTPDGLNIGALCVFDRTPHHLTPEQREMLTLLSRQVVHLLELRLVGRRIQWLNENLEDVVTKRTEELRESEERFRTLAEQSSEVFWFVGLNPERTLYVSPAVERIWGLPARRFYEDSRTWIKSLHCEDQARVCQAYEAALSGQSARFETEYRVLRPDGSLRWIMDSGTPIRNADGEIIRIGGMAKDITERKRAEAALRAANAELEAKNFELRRQAEDRLHRTRAEAAKAEADAARERSAFLAEASNVLASSLDYREMFDALSQLLIPSFADCCMVDFVQDNGVLQPIVVAHKDEEIGRRLTAFRSAFPTRLDEGRGFAAAQQGTAPVLCQQFGEKQIAGFARSPAEEKAMGQLEIRSYMVVALRARGRTLGGLCLASMTERRYDDADLSLAVGLAERAGLALDNSRLYAEARQAREASEAANAAKDRFLAMLSHELRTPLSPVLYATTLLENLPCPETIRGPLETIRRNVQLEARLIDDLLDLARIRNGKLQLQVESVDAHDLLRRAVEICEADIHKRNLRLTLDLRAPHPWLKADPARIQQIFWNLISNAVKYTPPEGAITLRTAEDESDGSICFAIVDTGIGLDPDQLERIFDAFEQGNRGRAGGLGLGLAICRALVTLHGGRIEARSRGSGQGSTFTVTLPADRALQAMQVNVPAVPLQPAATGLRLLLVEDHGDTAATLGRLLTNSGYAVQTANTFAAALRRLEESEFDLLVSDIGLPDGNGLDLMPRFIEVAGNRRIAGIALSGFGMPEDIERSCSAGFHEHLIKPVDFTLLRHALARAASEILATVPRDHFRAAQTSRTGG